MPGNMLRTTHEGMLNYLTPNLERKWMLDTMPGHFVATAIVTDLLREKILTPRVDCAEHGPCNFKMTPVSKYVGCHRYDQAALNMGIWTISSRLIL